MSSKTVVHTAIYGGFDGLKPHPDYPLISEWICHTDSPDLACDGWDVRVEEPRSKHPRLAAKWHKCHPPEADYSIWIDGSMDIHDMGFFSTVWLSLRSAELVLWPHPCHTGGIWEEAEKSLTVAKWHGTPQREMAEYYRDEWGWTSNELWASTTFGRKHTTAVLQWGAAWYAECERLHHDQISLPPLIRRYGLEVAALPHSLWNNPWFRLRTHKVGDR